MRVLILMKPVSLYFKYYSFMSFCGSQRSVLVYSLRLGNFHRIFGERITFPKTLIDKKEKKIVLGIANIKNKKLPCGIKFTKFVSLIFLYKQKHSSNVKIS